MHLQLESKPKLCKKMCSVSVTLETCGGRLPQREEDIAHDSGAADAGGGDNVEDAVDIMPKVFLRRPAAAVRQHSSPQSNKGDSTHPLRSSPHPVCLQVLGLLELHRVDFTGFVFRADL